MREHWFFPGKEKHLGDVAASTCGLKGEWFPLLLLTLLFMSSPLHCSQVHPKLLLLTAKESASVSSNLDYSRLWSNRGARRFAAWACFGTCKSWSEQWRFSRAAFDLEVWGMGLDAFVGGGVKWFLLELTLSESTLRFFLPSIRT